MNLFTRGDGPRCSALLRLAGTTAGTTPSREIGGRLGHAPGVAQGAAQDDLDLRIHAPQLVARPAGQRVVDGRVDPEENLATLAH